MVARQRCYQGPTLQNSNKHVCGARDASVHKTDYRARMHVHLNERSKQKRGRRGRGRLEHKEGGVHGIPDPALEGNKKAG